MKYSFLYLAVFITLFACKEKDASLNESCVTCKGGIVTKSYGVDSAITIYNVITPNIYDICDYMVFNEGHWVMPYELDNDLLCSREDYMQQTVKGIECACYSPDFKHVDQINSRFNIIGIEKFPYNALSLFVPDYTTPLGVYNDYRANGGFIGYFHTDTLLEPYMLKVYEGQLKYELVLYKDKTHEVPFDTIKGYVYVIRTPQECNPVGAQAEMPNDPMLTPGSF